LLVFNSTLYLHFNILGIGILIGMGIGIAIVIGIILDLGKGISLRP